MSTFDKVTKVTLFFYCTSLNDKKMWQERLFLTCADTHFVSVVSTGDTRLGFRKKRMTEKEAFIGNFRSLELKTKEKPKYCDKPECCH